MKALKTRFIVTACLLILTSIGLIESADADWHRGKVKAIVFLHEGSGVAFSLEGVVPTSCSCPSYWGGYVCLDMSRATHKQEYAFLLSAKARDVTINVHIDETTCMVTSMEEQ